MSALLSPIKDIHSERRLFLSRVILAASVSLLLLGLVVARLIQLQVIDHEMFAEKAQGNRVRIEPVPPIRGLIFDRKGRVIAENLPAYHQPDSGRGHRTVQGAKSRRPPLQTRHAEVSSH
jgi:hypothetical protein